MGTAIKHHMPDRVKPSLVILTFGHSDGQPGCQKLPMTDYPGLARSLHPYGNSGRQRVNNLTYVTMYRVY